LGISPNLLGLAQVRRLVFDLLNFVPFCGLSGKSPFLWLLVYSDHSDWLVFGFCDLRCWLYLNFAVKIEKKKENVFILLFNGDFNLLFPFVSSITVRPLRTVAFSNVDFFIFYVFVVSFLAMWSFSLPLFKDPVSFEF
jgi:hypothetical protein